MPAEQGPACVVQLRYASLPWGVGLLADHYWFVVTDEGSGECHRWEVWQTADAGGISTGHVHCDLKPPDADVGGGPTRIAAVWHGQEARALRAVLAQSGDYPHCHLYRYWPGPNSNTFAAWVLRRAGIEFPFPWRAIGATYGGA